MSESSNGASIDLALATEQESRAIDDSVMLDTERLLAELGDADLDDRWQSFRANPDPDKVQAVNSYVRQIHADRRRPLHGLPNLEANAIVGYDALVAATSEPIRWVWQGIISESNHVEIAGKSYSGKTTFAVFLAVALANPTGKPVVLFGREVTPIANDRYIVFVEEENGKHSIRKKFEIACQVFGLPPKETIDRMIILVRRDVRIGEAIWGDVVTLGNRGRIGAVFLDSRARILNRGDPNSEKDQADISSMLFRLIEASRAPMFVVSHTRKGDATSIEDFSGSGQRGAGTDVALVLTPTRDDRAKVTSSRIIFLKIRDDVEDHPEPVDFALAKDSAGTWTLITSDDGLTANPVTETVLDVLHEHDPTALSLSNIRKYVSIKRGGKPGSKADPEPVKKALARLVKDDLAVRTTVKTRNREFDAWRAGTDPTPDEPDPAYRSRS